MLGRARIVPDDLELEAEGRARHREVNGKHGRERDDDADVDQRVADSRQAVLHRQQYGLRHRALRVPQNGLDQEGSG